MQVRKRCAYLGKVIGLHAEPMLFRGFDRELTKARERAGSRVHKCCCLTCSSVIRWIPSERTGFPSVEAALPNCRGPSSFRRLPPVAKDNPSPNPLNGIDDVPWRTRWNRKKWILSHSGPQGQNHNGDGGNQ